MNGFKNSIYKLGRNIAEIRKKRGYTQKSFGEILDVNEKTISKWERGITAPDVTLLTSIADVLNVTVDELLRGEKLDNEEKVIENDNVFNVEEEEKSPEVNEDSDSSDVGLEKRYLGGEGISICVVDLYTGNARRRILASISIIIAIIIVSVSIFAITKNHYEWKKIDIHGSGTYDVYGYIFKNDKEFQLVIDKIVYITDTPGVIENPVTGYIKVSLLSGQRVFYSREYNLENEISVYDYFSDFSLLYVSTKIIPKLDNLHIRIEYLDDFNEIQCSDIFFKRS